MTPFERFLSSPSLQACLDEDDFSQLDEVMASHQLTSSVARAHLAIRLENEKLETENKRNFLLSLFGLFGCLSSIVGYISYIVRMKSTNDLYADITYGIGIMITAAQILCAYLTYYALGEDIRRTPLRRLYLYLKYAPETKAPPPS